MFKVYKASAGSGKTTSLVAEYLAVCLLKPDLFRHILAVTFTNNATAEMKDRIVRSLTSFAFSPVASLKGTDKAIYEISKQLEPEIAVLSEQQLQEKAQILLRKILYDYPNFTISTIDSFFQRLIRSFAFDLGLNMNYNVEIELSQCFDQAIDTLLNRLSENDGGLSARVLEIVEDQMTEKGKWRIDNVLKKVLYAIYDEKAFLPAKALSLLYERKLTVDGKQSDVLTETVISLRKTRTETVATIRKLIIQLQNIINTLGESQDNFKYKSKGIYEWVFHQLPSDYLYKANSYVEKTVDSDSVLSASTAASKTIQPAVCELYQQILQLQEKLRLLNLVTKNSSTLLLFFDLKAVMDEIKTRNNLFYLSEANLRIFEEIKDDDAPYIFEKIGNRYSHFFIDEFQDTSHLQWEDLKPLLFNTLSSERYNNQPGEVILFGDVKQAIYRFRNGDSRLLSLLSTEDGFKQSFDSLYAGDDTVFSVKKLTTNYRSAKTIVDFNNAFFKFLVEGPFGSYENIASYYEDVLQSTCLQQKGFVSIRFRTDEDSADYVSVEALNAINNALSKGYNYKDIAFVSKANDTCSAVANYLSAHNVPVVSSESLLLSSSEDVLFLVNCLKYLLSPKDKLTQMAIASYLWRDELTDAVESICRTGGFSLLIKETGKNDTDVSEDSNHYVRRRKRVKNGQILLGVQHLSSMPVFTIVRELIAAFGLDEADAYVIAFMDAVFDNFNTQFSDLTQFVRWWDEKGGSLSISSSKESDAVTISTIHRSKGLQYPIVIFAMQNYKSSHSEEVAWVKNENEEIELPYFFLDTSSKSLEGTPYQEVGAEESERTAIDNLNLIYVAHTRAQEGLYILTGKLSKNSNYTKFVNDFIYKLAESRDSILVKNGFQEDPETHELSIPKGICQFWLGDENTIKENMTQTDAADIGIRKIHTSDFTLQSKALAYKPVKNSWQEQGIFIHDFLSKLKKFPQNIQEIGVVTAELTEEEQILMRPVLKKILEDDTLIPYFSPEAKVLNEATVLCVDGHLKRPDRIVFLEDEVMVIDYKTGQPNESYQQQLDEYCNLLVQMGYQNVKSRILYV